MRWLVVTAVSLAGCSYQPVADLRVSGDKAQLYQRDVSECRLLVDQAMAWSIGGIKAKAMNDCLRGRGHSIIGG